MLAETQTARQGRGFSVCWFFIHTLRFNSPFNFSTVWLFARGKGNSKQTKKKHSFRSGLVLDRGLENCFIMFHSRFLCIAILSILRFIMYTKHTSSTLYTLVTDSDIYRLHHRVFVPASPRLILLINILSCFALSPLRRRRLRFHLHFPLFQLIIADVVIARDCVSMQVRWFSCL